MSGSRRSGYYKTIKKEEMVLDVTFVGSRCPDGNFPCNREKEVI